MAAPNMLPPPDPEGNCEKCFYYGKVTVGDGWVLMETCTWKLHNAGRVRPCTPRKGEGGKRHDRETGGA